MIKKYLSLSVILISGLFLVSCTQSTQKIVEQKKYVVDSQVDHPDWTESAVIYEVNIRQHTDEGTFEAFREHLPRLQEMGVDIIWLMPVFPIGELNRKISQTVLIEEIEDPGEREKYLGSYYSTSDYFSVNPEFGTMHDLKKLIKSAHGLGIQVILDIAVNHTAWDHPWVTEHPEYYTRVEADSTPWKPEWMTEHPGYFQGLKDLGMTYPIHPSETDWWDVADLNYENEDLRHAIKEVFKFWVDEADVDGYRCDVAGWVPCDFWNDVRVSLDSLKPVFMLAEDEANRCLMEEAFDMNYAWELHHILNQIAKGEMEIADLTDYYTRIDSIWDPAIYRMNFITNHDENSWNGTVSERFGDAAEVYALLSFTLPGMPLLYSGQETGLNKRLKFFEKDAIEWEESPWEEIYTNFITLKKDNEALWNGTAGGAMKVLELADSENIFAFERSNKDSRIIVLTNLGSEKTEISLDEAYHDSDWIEAFTLELIDFKEKIVLEAVSYKVLIED